MRICRERANTVCKVCNLALACPAVLCRHDVTTCSGVCSRQGIRVCARGFSKKATAMSCCLRAWQPVSEVDQNVVVADFNHARRYSMLVCTLKFSHWEQLPWLLIGISHHDCQKARRCAARALQLQDAAPCEHELARLLCGEGSQGRHEMSAFVRGEPLSNLPLLQSYAAKFKFVPVSERWVESRHALIKRHLRKCTHASALHVAFMSCQSLLRDIFQNMPHEFERLVLFCELTKSPLQALQSVRLHWRPQVQRVLQTNRAQLGRSYRPWVIELLYHVDWATLFQDLPSDGGFVPDNSDDSPARPGLQGKLLLRTGTAQQMWPSLRTRRVSRVLACNCLCKHRERPKP